MILVFTKSTQTKTLKCVSKSTFKVCAYSVNPISFSSKTNATVNVKQAKPILINMKGKVTITPTPTGLITSPFATKCKSTVKVNPFLTNTNVVKTRNTSKFTAIKNTLLTVKLVTLSKSKLLIAKTCYTTVKVSSVSLKTLFILKAKTAQESEIHSKSVSSLSPQFPKIARSKLVITSLSSLKIQKYNKRYKG